MQANPSPERLRPAQPAVNPRVGERVVGETQLIPAPGGAGSDGSLRSTPVTPGGFEGQFNRRTLLAGSSLLLAAAAPAWAQAEKLHIDPSEFGFEIPAATPRPGAGRCVQTNDRDGKPVVARLHVEVGSHRIVMLPDGELAARSERDAPLTDRKFEPISKDDLAKQLLNDKLAGFKTRQSRRYLYVYNTTDTFALVTSRILESMFPGISTYYENQRLGVKSAEVPLVVLMFRTEEEFQYYQRMPPGVLAYYNILTNHVVMYEESKLAKLKAELAIQQGISTIAHEGAHQILHNIGVQQRLSRWPMWLSEGLAEYFAPTTVGKRLQWKGPGQVNDLRMHELERYLKGRDGDTPNGEMINHTVTAARLTSTGYASAWALTSFLASKERAKFNKLVADVSKLGPLEGTRIVGQGLIPENMNAFKDHFGDDLGALEERLVAYLKKLPYVDPFKEWPHFAAFILATVDGRPRREANIFHSPQAAEKWRREAVEKLPADARDNAQVAVQMFPNRLHAERAATNFLRSR